MRFIIITLIFVIVLFLYLHIFFHLKTSNDLEVYECETPDKDELEEICGLRQPVIFNYVDSVHTECNKSSLVENYSSFDLKIRNINRVISDDEELYIPLRMDEMYKVIDSDKKGCYISESNEDFLEETGLLKTFKYSDSLLRPYLTCKCEYDLMFGSTNSVTPFRYNLNYRNYYNVIKGNIRIKMTPPKNIKFLHEQKDYDNYEFRSQINPWNVSEAYKSDFDKFKCLEVELREGQLIYVPAYWWYSIEYGENTMISCYKYHTYMSIASISQHISLALLQSQNIKRVPYLNIINNINVNVETDSSSNATSDSSFNSTSGSSTNFTTDTSFNPID